MFNDLRMAPPDPILGLTEDYKANPNPKKINLGVGVYKDEHGKTPIFNTVKKAERLLLDQEDTKSYLPIPGTPEFARAVQGLLFGANSDILMKERAATAQTPGGTGALRVAADFLKMIHINPEFSIWVSDPTWANHMGIFGAAGVPVKKYPYYDAATQSICFDQMISALQSAPEGDVILLHGCCHNPTGVDPSAEQWETIAETLVSRKLIPMIDIAYQGLAKNFDDDAAGVRALAARGLDMIICGSFSKNMGLYRDRAGALTLVAETQRSAQAAMSHMKVAIRRNYSNPPAHGGAIVSTILNTPDLRKEWEGEVALMRDRIQGMRDLFVEKISSLTDKMDFSFIRDQNGMFSFSGLGPDHVEMLKEKYSIFIVNSGRINVAGLTRGNMDYMCEALSDIL